MANISRLLHAHYVIARNNVIILLVPSFLQLDINECSSATCDRNGFCTNTPGSFNCTCNAGLIGDGVSCGGMCPALICNIYSDCFSKTEQVNWVKCIFGFSRKQYNFHLSNSSSVIELGTFLQTVIKSDMLQLIIKKLPFTVIKGSVHRPSILQVSLLGQAHRAYCDQ